MMRQQGLQLAKIRWVRWTAGAAALLAAYSAAGFWLLPQVIKNQLPKLGQSELERQLSVGDVRFNPYTLRLEAQDLRLAEADGKPFAEVGKLAVEMQWRSLFRRAWSFAEISISAPSVHLAIAQDGKFNLAELLATLARRPHDDAKALPRLVIERFALEDGKVEWRDRRAGFADNVVPIHFTLANFSTLPDQTGNYTLSADLEHGGKLRWKGDASVSPIRASGELTLQDASLPELAVYLKPYTRATMAAGKLDAALPYRLSFDNGKLDASLAGASLALRDLALAREGASDSFTTLTRLDVKGVDADLVRRVATVGQVRADGGKLTVRRDAKGELDLAHLMVAAAGPAAAPDHAVVVHDWKLKLPQVVLDQIALTAVDETVSPPLTLSVKKARLNFGLLAEQAGANLNLAVSDAALSLADLALASGAKTPFKLGQLGFSDGAFDLAARRASIGRVFADDGQLQLTRDRKGQLNILSMLPKFNGAKKTQPVAPTGAPWVAAVKSVELSRFGSEILDEGTGVKVHVQDLAAKLEGASSDLKQPIKFNAGLALREGGRLSAQGSLVPANSAVQADVRVTRLALAPLQPLLGKYVTLKIAGGNVSAKGRLATRAQGMRYTGGFEIAGLALNEQSGVPFASWKNVRADKLTASIGPNFLDIPLLRVVEPDAKLIIEDDHSFNAARLLVKSASTEAPTPPAPAATPAFPVRIQRVRFENAKLDFTDLSLRPQFSAKIYELNGDVTGLSTTRDTHSQIDLDGRVNEYGMARIRGNLNAFAPREDTDINVVFKNVDMVSTSPYAMKFAGYKVADGKISLDLQYKVHNSQLEGANQIVIDNLTLGDRVDSPDAFKLPLTLAIAILKDSDGRIDLGVPVTGSMDDPQFNYGAVIRKAIFNVLTRIVTAPFRALGSLFGGSGEQLEAIDFDPGSDTLLPPEREKLAKVAQILAKRTQLKLTVPGQYSEASDGAVLKARAVRAEIDKRAGVKLQPGERPGPVDLGDRSVRSAMRSLYAERFGSAELDKQKKAAEDGPVAAGQQKKLPIWQRVGKMVQGEPQVADASAFYKKLQDRLEQTQVLPAGSLARLGEQRSHAILGALIEAGVDPASIGAKAPEAVGADSGKAVALKLELGVK